MKRKNEADQEKDNPAKRQKTGLLSLISGWVSSFFEKEKEIEKEDQKEAENTFLPLQDLPLEVIRRIGKFLPSYHYMGKKALPVVCHQFNSLFHSTTLLSKQKRTKESIMKSCYTLEDTLHVFSCKPSNIPSFLNRNTVF